MTKMKKLVRFAFVFFLLSASVLAQPAKDRYAPERVILNLTDKPALVIELNIMDKDKPDVELTR